MVDDDNGGVARGITNTRLPGLSWTKVGSEDTAKPLKGSVWKINGNTPDNKPIAIDEIKDCVDEGSEAAGKNATTDPCENYTDKDPEAGKFRIENLQKGTYTLTETAAPEGHWLSTDTYTFTVEGTPGEKVQLKKNTEDVQSNTIVDETMGVAWTKSDSNDKTGEHPLANSAWKIYPTEKGSNSEKTITVTDCASNPCPSASKDLDTAQGKFKVTGLTPGQYTLEETQAPDGYQLPEKKTWTFEIKSSTATSDPQHTITDVKITGDNLGTGGNVILNSKTPVSQLPFTGGRSGLDWLIIGGGLALAAAAAGLVTGKAKRREEL